MGVICFKVGRDAQWTFGDGLGVNPKVDPETIGLANLILRQVAKPSLYQGTPSCFIDRELGEVCIYE